MLVKLSTYGDDGYRHSEKHLDDAIQELIDKTPDGYVMGKLIEILVKKGALLEDDLQSMFSYIDAEIKFIKKPVSFT